MDRARGAAVVLGAVVVVVLAGAVVAGPGTDQTLVVEDEAGAELLAVPVDEGTTVSLEYTHSVEKTPVRDVYEVRDGRLAIQYMEFRSFGAGLPSQANVTRSGNGTYIYNPPDRRSSELVVATGTVADHDLVVDGRRYDLAGRADGGTVRLSVTDRLALAGGPGGAVGVVEHERGAGGAEITGERSSVPARPTETT